ncbi:ATP-grasp domain-containing protein [Micromonospora sp. LOL_021]|uniref:ATP-grasp domain-containing protein n=1 Tax=Micromonospora sp. LOL_021 TaxID=3345417 RepID=UPI003A83BB46
MPGDPPRLPALAVICDIVGSMSPVDIARSAAGRAELLYLVDAGDNDLIELCQSLAQTYAVRVDDPQAIATLLRDLGVNAVTTFSDPHCAVVDAVNAVLRGDDPDRDSRWRKDMQRDSLVRHGLSKIVASRFHSAHELQQLVTRQGVPLVVKPRRGAASRDVWLLNTRQDVNQFLLAAAGGRRDLDDFVAETYVQGVRPAAHRHVGDYISVELFVHRKGFSAFVTDRPPIAWPCRETGIIGPTVLSASDQKAAVDLAVDAHAALGGGFGAFHVEIKLSEPTPEVIEVNGRLGGYVRRLVQYGAGIDVGPWAIASALGADPQPRAPMLTWDRAVMGVLFQAPPSAVSVEAAPARKALLQLPGVLAVEAVAQPGSLVDWQMGSGGAVAKLWIAGRDHSELGDRARTVAKVLSSSFMFITAEGDTVREKDFVASMS